MDLQKYLHRLTSAMSAKELCRVKKEDEPRVGAGAQGRSQVKRFTPVRLLPTLHAELSQIRQRPVYGLAGHGFRLCTVEAQTRVNKNRTRVGCERFLQLEQRNVFITANDELFLRFSCDSAEQQ
jgi:hypothetical protein